MKSTQLTPEEESLVEEAKTAESCKDWWQHCKANCCRYFILNRNEGWGELKKGQIIKYRVGPENNNPGMRWYFQLHNCKLDRGILTITLEDFKIEGNKLTIYKRCVKLQDSGRCGGWPDQRPSICHAYDQKTACTGQYSDPPKCLYKIKKVLQDREA